MQQIELPTNWRVVLDGVKAPCRVTDIMRAFSVSNSTYYRWLKRHRDFKLAIDRKMQRTTSVRRQMTPLPDDWRERLAALPDKAGNAAICETLDIGRTCLENWRMRDPDVDALVISKLRRPVTMLRTKNVLALHARIEELESEIDELKSIVATDDLASRNLRLIREINALKSGL